MAHVTLDCKVAMFATLSVGYKRVFTCLIAHAGECFVYGEDSRYFAQYFAE